MNYKTLIFSLVLLVATWAWNISSAQAYSSYYVYDQWGGTYYDADKSFSSQDSSMCWAASASDILAWTGWGKSYSTSADAIFAYFQDHWTNAGGNVYYGWDWWFDGTNNSQGYSRWSQVDVAGGGFWTSYSLSDYFWGTSTDSAAMWAIDYLFDNGYAVSLGITPNGINGHAITCWGYEYDEYGNIVGIYVTDSDDSYDGLKLYSVVSSNGKWYLQDFYGYNTWYITEVDGLKICSVPEPTAMLLLGFGLIGLAGLRKRLKK